MAAPQQQLPWPWLQQTQRHAHHDGGLLLASISDAMNRPPWAQPPAVSRASSSKPSKLSTSKDGDAVPSTLITRGPMPVAQLALAPPSSDAAASQSSSSHVLQPGDFAMHANGKQQQQQQERQGRSWLGGGSSGAAPHGNAGGPLQALSRHVNSEAGKAVALIGTQLLLHWANLQRGIARQQHSSSDPEQQHQHQQQQQQWRPRFPWQRRDTEQGGSSSDKRAGEKPWQASAAASQWVARGIAAERRLELREALACYTNAVALDPTMTNLCHLAKQWSDLTYEPGAEFAQIAEVNRKATEYAERAIAVAPKQAGGYMAACVSKGRLALFSDNKTKVRLAKEARESAVLALELEPHNDLAHHLMGRWHFEMAQLNFMVRQLVRFVFGTSLAPGSFQDALHEFGTAVQLNPTKLIHRVEYGRTLLRLGRKQEALRELSHSISLDVEDINAELQKEDAELLVNRLTAELNSSKKGWGSFLAPLEAPQQAAPEAAAGSAVSRDGNGPQQP